MTNAKECQQILIVEDEGDMCLVLEMILHKKNVAIDHVKKIGAAEAYLKNAAPDLIILDNCLPDGLGVNFIPFIKRFYPEVKIIMISGKEGPIRNVALEYGANLFLSKPFSRLELLRSVVSLLNAQCDFMEDVSAQ
ncbi:MAG TPA: response regulator [Puia sp.]|jgi:two-component system OmpR family response regulator|nr:response regulator [Puia sp.]